MDNNSKNDNAKRTKYIRLLERFVYSISGHLAQAEDTTKASFFKKVKKQYRFLEKQEPVLLYKQELLYLEKVAQAIINLENTNKNIEDIKDEVNNLVNQLEKNKKQRQYKKDKHKQNVFNDDY